MRVSDTEASENVLIVMREILKEARKIRLFFEAITGEDSEFSDAFNEERL